MQIIRRMRNDILYDKRKSHFKCNDTGSSKASGWIPPLFALYGRGNVPRYLIDCSLEPCIKINFSHLK